MSSVLAPAQSRTTYLNRCVHAQVVQARSITPHLKRVTIADDSLRGFPWHGPDQWFRLFLPKPGQERPVLPTRSDDWWPQLVAMPDEIRPWIRNYTVRRLRPEAGEIDIDFVLHGDTGPASRWALNVAPGHWIGLLDQTAPYDPSEGCRWQLLVGDETALPAISAIVENLPAGARARAYIEVPSEADLLELAAPDSVDVTWLPREPRDADVGTLAIDAVRGATLGDGPDGYAWVAGESAMIRQVRRHLVTQRGMQKDAIYFCGYWRRGVSYAD